MATIDNIEYYKSAYCPDLYYSVNHMQRKVTSLVMLKNIMNYDAFMAYADMFYIKVPESEVFLWKI